jgi:hypothetical protein
LPPTSTIAIEPSAEICEGFGTMQRIRRLYE